MLKHIVMWRLKDSADGKTKAENARVLKSSLESLKNKILQLKNIEAGINIRPSEHASDVVVVSEFEDEKALAAYQTHPAHQKIVEFVKEIVTERRVVDFKS